MNYFLQNVDKFSEKINIHNSYFFKQHSNTCLLTAKNNISINKIKLK